MSGRSRLVVINVAIALVILLAAGGTVYALTTSSSSSSVPRTTPVGRGTVAETVTASGTVTTATSATLNFSSSGKIAEIGVRLGDHVEKGQVVARLDGDYAQANLRAAQAQVSSAQQQLDDAQDARDHPTTTAAPAATGGAAAAPAAAAPAAAAPAPAPAPASPTPTRSSGGGGFWGDGFAARSTGVEAFPAQGGATPTPSPNGSSSGSASSGGAASGGASGSSPEAAVRSAEASLAQAKASRIQAEQATDDLELVAPAAGTVVSLDGLVGQIAGPQGVVVSSTGTGNPAGGRLPDGSAVSSGAGSGSSGASSGGAGAAGAAGSAAGGSGGSSGVTAAPAAPAVMTIADLSAMQILAQIPELDVGRVADGQPVDVSVNALPGERIPGTVATVNMLPGSGQTVQYGTAIAMPAPPLGLRPGMSASVAITVRRADDVTFLPSVAVTPVGGADSGQATVQVLAPDGSTQQRTIGTGLSSDTVTQVTSGLAPGELVVLPDPDTPSVFGPGQRPPSTEGGTQGSTRSGG